MPGIYVQDGGETASALGKILGGVAANMSPQAQAEAQALRYRTEGLDIANQAAAEQLQSRDWATSQGPAALGQANGLPGAPGSVADTVAGMATPPPLVGAYRHPAGAVLSSNPYAAQVQNWIQSGQATPEAWKGSILPVGQTMTTGPGTDYNTQTEVAKAKAVPYDLTAGVARHIPGGAPAGGETVVQGPDPSTQAAVTKGLEDTTTQAQTAFDRGKQAVSDKAELDDIAKGYDALVNIPDGDVTAPGVLEGLKAATAATGGAFDFSRFSSKQEAINDLTARMQAMLGSARAAQGDPALRGSIDVMLRELDVAKNSSPSFHRMVEAIGRQQQALIDEGAASNEFLKAPNPAGAAALRERIIENRIRAAQELRRSGFSADTSAGDGGQTAPPAPAPPAPPQALRPATPQEKVFANQAIAAGQSRADVIAHGRQKGIDLEASGF